jgi:hypothetical protein
MGRSDCPDIPSPKILNLLRRRVVLSCLHRRNCQMNWMVTCVGVVMNLKSFSKVVYHAKKTYMTQNSQYTEYLTNDWQFLTHWNAITFATKLCIYKLRNASSHQAFDSAKVSG